MRRSILFLLLFRCVSSAQNFTTPVGSPVRVGVDPVAIVSADFNGDGFRDLAVANYDDNTITILLGNGRGGFSPAPGSPVASGVSPIALVAGDFNRDGKPDLAVANGDGSISILLGNGTGGFLPGPGSPIATSLFQVSIASGDFNSDGKLDLVIADELSDSVTVLMGDGAGGFTPAPNSPVAAGTDPRFVVVADFNRDGKADLAIANGDVATVTVLLGNGSGGFTVAPGSPYRAGMGASAIAVGLFNRDNNLDLAVVNGGADSMTVLLGNGSGGFLPAPGSPFTTSPMPTSIAAADFNADGLHDLAVASETANAVTVYLASSVGDGSFIPGNSTPTGELPAAVVTADFNADGLPDLATANSFSDDVSILLANATGSSWSISKSHSGNFTSGQLSANYSLNITNTGAAFAGGLVTVTDAYPAGLNLVALSGSGWSCATNTCTRRDALASGQSYPAITATFNVAPDAPSTLVNKATVTPPQGPSSTALDSTNIVPSSGVYFTSVPTGATFTVDGAAYTTPFALALSSGSHTISPAAIISGATGVQYTNPTWSDNTNLGPSRTITITPAQPASYSATYTTQYLLTVLSVPTDGGSASPATGYYTAGATVPVTARPSQGFQFAFWLGGVTPPTNTSGSVTMTGPLTVTASFNTDSNAFVTSLYQDLLNRTPDSTGLAYWTGQLSLGAYTRSSMAGQFFTSPEFSQNGLYVIKLYIAILKRDPDFAGWKFWNDQLRLGVPAINVLNSFITAPEFTTLYGNASNQDLVTLLYRNVLGRDPDANGLNYWLGLLNNGTYNRGTLTDQFVRSPEFDTSVRARAYANLLYMGFLRRTADPTGLSYWTGILNDPTALAGAVGNFITSPEYLKRF